MPGSAKAGAFVGRVAATDQDAGAAGRLVYSFDHLTDYFQVDPVSGNITVSHTLHEDIAEEGDKTLLRQRRRKRALRSDSEALIVRVSSGMENSRSATVFCLINIDRTCAGCQAPAPAELVDTSGLSSVAIAMIVLVCILVPSIIVVLLLVFICRRRNRKGVPSAMNGAAEYGGRGDSLGITQSPLDDQGVPPSYKDVLHGYGSNHHNSHSRPINNVTSSDISEQSNNSASSGRGSAEVEEDEDEEIRMINASNYLTNSAGFRHKTMPDSGIQQDDDTLSEPSATNHQEYLARLGIDSSKIGKSGAKGSSSKGSTSGGSATGGDGIAFSVESMHQFSDEGGGEGGVDFDRFTDTEVDEEMVMIENSRRSQLQAMNAAAPPAGGVSFQPPDPQNAGTLSNVVNSEEEYSGSYNWDYLLDWGPQYQPLAHVFAEIAKLKDETVTPKKTPVKTVPQRRINGTQGLAMPQARIVPPPIITNAPPPGEVVKSGGGDHGGRGSESGGGGGGGGSSSSRVVHSHNSVTSSTSSTGGRSQRTSAMNSSLPSLPRSPISYESSYTSPALTPSFTPSLSPLGAHTPSISPAVSGHTSGHASGHASNHSGPASGPASSHSGHNTPGKPVSNHHLQGHPHHHHHQHQHHHRQHNQHNGRGQYNNSNHNNNSNSNNNNIGNSNNPRLTLSVSSDSEREFRI